MGLNLIDFSKAEVAANQITDTATRQIATQLVPVVQAAAEAVIGHAQDRLDASLGNALSALTAERMQIFDQAHGLLDRLNGAKLMFIEGGFQIQVPEQKC
jgi:hypothetical protein